MSGMVPPKKGTLTRGPAGWTVKAPPSAPVVPSQGGMNLEGMNLKMNVQMGLDSVQGSIDGLTSAVMNAAQIMAESVIQSNSQLAAAFSDKIDMLAMEIRKKNMSVVVNPPVVHVAAPVVKVMSPKVSVDAPVVHVNPTIQAHSGTIHVTATLPNIGKSFKIKKGEDGAYTGTVTPGREG